MNDESGSMQTKTFFTVRYAETDQMKIVHHSNYAVWFEAGRTDYLKKAGAPYSGIEAKGVLLPLYEMNCKFKAPARYEDEIVVVTNIKQCSRVRLCFSYQVFGGSENRLIATGETMHAWTDKAFKPIDAQGTVPDIFAILNTHIRIREKDDQKKLR